MPLGHYRELIRPIVAVSLVALMEPSSPTFAKAWAIPAGRPLTRLADGEPFGQEKPEVSCAGAPRLRMALPLRWSDA